MPPHSFLFGHLRVVASIVGGLPPFIHGVYIADQVRQKYPEMDTAFYLDIWPIGKPYLMVLKPDMVAQFTQANQLPKDPGLTRFLKPIAGKQNLVTMEGAPWKRWRSIFNPGFSPSHISTLVPGMVENVEMFKKKVRMHAQTGGMFYLEEMLLNLTIDIIGGAVMYVRHGIQTCLELTDIGITTFRVNPGTTTWLLHYAVRYHGHRQGLRSIYSKNSTLCDHSLICTTPGGWTATSSRELKNDTVPS
jgi:hypothetical protein